MRPLRHPARWLLLLAFTLPLAGSSWATAEEECLPVVVDDGGGSGDVPSSPIVDEVRENVQADDVCPPDLEALSDPVPHCDSSGDMSDHDQIDCGFTCGADSQLYVEVYSHDPPPGINEVWGDVTCDDVTGSCRGSRQCGGVSREYTSKSATASCVGDTEDTDDQLDVYCESIYGKTGDPARSLRMQRDGDVLTVTQRAWIPGCCAVVRAFVGEIPAEGGPIPLREVRADA